METMNRYTMVFALDAFFDEVLLLRKPFTHPNELFRGRWTVPGGKIEGSEGARKGAKREFKEETGLDIPLSKFQYSLRFACDCDPAEDEHEIVVYGLTLHTTQLMQAKGSVAEPLEVFHTHQLPSFLLWTTEPLLQLVIGRMTP